MLGERVVLRARRPPEVIKAKAKSFGDLGLHFVHFSTIVSNRFAGLGGGELGRGTVLVGGAEEQHLVAPGALVAGKEIRRELAAHEIAQMLDAIDIRQRGGNQIAGHGLSIRGKCLRGERLLQRLLQRRAAVLHHTEVDGRTAEPQPGTAPERIRHRSVVRDPRIRGARSLRVVLELFDQDGLLERRRGRPRDLPLCLDFLRADKE